LFHEKETVAVVPLPEEPFKHALLSAGANNVTLSGATTTGGSGGFGGSGVGSSPPPQFNAVKSVRQLRAMKYSIRFMIIHFNLMATAFTRGSKILEL
jgi:hypothetical protein